MDLFHFNLSLKRLNLLSNQSKKQKNIEFKLT